MLLGTLSVGAATNLSWRYDKCCAGFWSLKIDGVRVLINQLNLIAELVRTTSHPKLLIRKQFLCLVFHVLLIVYVDPDRMVVRCINATSACHYLTCDIDCRRHRSVLISPLSAEVDQWFAAGCCSSVLLYSPLIKLIAQNNWNTRKPLTHIYHVYQILPWIQISVLNPLVVYLDNKIVLFVKRIYSLLIH